MMGPVNNRHIIRQDAMLLPTTVQPTTTLGSLDHTPQATNCFLSDEESQIDTKIWPILRKDVAHCALLCSHYCSPPIWAVCELTFSDTDVVTMEASVARMEQRNSSMFVTPVNFGRNCVREELFSMDWHSTNCRNYVTFILVVSGCWWCFYAVLSTWKDFQYLKSITINASFLD